MDMSKTSSSGTEEIYTLIGASLEDEESILEHKILNEISIRRRTCEIYSLLNQGSLLPPDIKEIILEVKNESITAIKLYFNNDEANYNKFFNNYKNFILDIDSIVENELYWSELPYRIGDLMIYPSPKVISKKEYFKLIERLKVIKDK